MSALDVQDYSADRRSGVPRLFSKTRDFRFNDKNGALTHRSLPVGPRGYRVISVETTGHEAAFEENERVALTLPRFGHAEVSVEGRDLRVRPGDAFFLGPSQRRCALKPGPDRSPYRSFTIISPPRMGSVLGAESWIVRPDYRACPEFRDLLDLAFRLAAKSKASSPFSAASFETLIEEMMIDALAPGRDDMASRSGQAEIVRAARDFMFATIGQPISIPEVAAAVAVPTRILQDAFRHVCGQTPRQYLSELRMGEMRRTLLRPGTETTVTSAAMDAGLFHLGRVGGAYVDRFGELPSETLRRARAKAVVA